MEFGFTGHHKKAILLCQTLAFELNNNFEICERDLIWQIDSSLRPVYEIKGFDGTLVVSIKITKLRSRQVYEKFHFISIY